MVRGPEQAKIAGPGMVVGPAFEYSACSNRAGRVVAQVWDT